VIGQGPMRPLILPRSLNPPMPAPFLLEPPARLLLLAGDRAKVVEVSSGREVAGGFSFPEPVLATSSVDTKPLIRSDMKFMVVRTVRGEWQAWELDGDGVRHVVKLQDAPTTAGAVVFSAAGDLVSIATVEVRGWNLRTGVPEGPAFSPSAALVYVTANFSPDGKRLALGTADGAALIVDVATARPVVKFATRPLVPNQRVLFSPDGLRVVTANVQEETRLWDAISGQPISPATHIPGDGQSVFSADGRWLAHWSDNRTSLWDGRTGVPVGKIISGGGKIVRFNSDGSRLATAEREGDAQIWDVPSGEALTEPLSHRPSSAMNPQFSPDGRFLRTEGARFYLWSLPPPANKGAAVPEWLLQLATLSASKIVDEHGELVDDPAAFSRADALRREIAALPADSPFAEWGRWILDDRPDRPIAPGFTITPAEADKLAAGSAP
ncbi:MAG: WD40 repeat domain-containing protein, partial [Opitutaceae bacterium]